MYMTYVAKFMETCDHIYRCVGDNKLLIAMTQKLTSYVMCVTRSHNIYNVQNFGGKIFRWKYLTLKTDDVSTPGVTKWVKY